MVVEKHLDPWSTYHLVQPASILVRFPNPFSGTQAGTFIFFNPRLFHYIPLAVEKAPDSMLPNRLVMPLMVMLSHDTPLVLEKAPGSSLPNRFRSHGKFAPVPARRREVEQQVTRCSYRIFFSSDRSSGEKHTLFIAVFCFYHYSACHYFAIIILAGVFNTSVTIMMSS